MLPGYGEPFVGGGAVLTTAARLPVHPGRRRSRGSHRHVPGHPGRFNPAETVTGYRALKDSDPSPLRAFAAFGASFGGKESGVGSRNVGYNYVRASANVW